MPIVTVNIPSTTFTTSAQPDTNLSYYPVMYAGNDSSFLSCASLMQIALPTLSAPLVDSATLALTVVAKASDGPSAIVVNRVTAPFNVTAVTAHTLPAYVSTGTQVVVEESDLYTAVEIDITDIVNGWLAGTYPNFGIALTSAAPAVQFATNPITYEPYYPKLVISYSNPTPQGTAAIDFCYEQLAHLLTQISTLYPTQVITVFTAGLTASSITGTPAGVYASPEASFGMLLILDDGTQHQLIPLTSITAVVPAAGTALDPSISYLPAPDFSPGYDKNLLTDYYDYLTVGANFDIYLGSNVHATGPLYQNEYGILVLYEPAGDPATNAPVFIPVSNINVLITVEGVSAPAEGVSAPAARVAFSKEGVPVPAHVGEVAPSAPVTAIPAIPAPPAAAADAPASRPEEKAAQESTASKDAPDPGAAKEEETQD